MSLSTSKDVVTKRYKGWPQESRDNFNTENMNKIYSSAETDAFGGTEENIEIQILKENYSNDENLEGYDNDDNRGYFLYKE